MVADTELEMYIQKSVYIEQYIVKCLSINTFCEKFSTIQENILMDKNLN